MQITKEIEKIKSVISSRGMGWYMSFEALSILLRYYTIPICQKHDSYAKLLELTLPKHLAIQVRKNDVKQYMKWYIFVYCKWYVFVLSNI